MPRPEGTYPRQIEHDERVEYRYDPSNGEFDAVVVESSEPVVTGWDRTAPDREERSVGTWDVTPTNDGVLSERSGRVAVPEGVKARLVAEAEETGEPSSTIAKVRYRHDLDTRETAAVRPRLTAAAVMRARSRQPRDELSDGYRRILANHTKAQQQKRASNRRRSGRRRDDTKDGPYTLPDLVVAYDGSSERRYGGL